MIKTIQILTVTALVLGAAGLAIFLGATDARAASTVRVSGSSANDQVLAEMQAQTKHLERIARALEEIAKR